MSHTPDISVSYRPFRGEPDYANIYHIINQCTLHDQLDFVPTLADVANNYSHLVNSDPYQDMIFAEVDGQAVGYARAEWIVNEAGEWLGGTVGYVLPAYRRRGIGAHLLTFAEDRIRAFAAQQLTAGALAPDAPRWIQNFVSEVETEKIALYERFGYRPIRYTFDMVRPDLENIPDLPLPEGVEVRPAQPEQRRAIWDASTEAFRDHWGFVQPNEEDYQRWLDDPINDSSLWQVAWEGEQVAGMVLNFINAHENETYQRKRGYTENICVRRPWRKKGLARALIARSLHTLKERGMEHAALGVDAENISGATRLYESMGYQVVKRGVIYRKPLE